MTPAAAPAPCPVLDPIELAGRWSRAREAALDRLGAGEQGEPESQRARAAAGARFEDLLREVGRNSWRLGRSVARSFGTVDEIEPLATLLAASGMPCAQGVRRTDDEISICTRADCGTTASGTEICDFYREALDGFVCGASERLRFSRWRSAPRNRGRCGDVLHSAERPDARFEPLPPEVHDHLAGPLERLGAKGVGIELLGIAENRVYVRSETGRSAACGPGKLYIDLLASHLAARFPDLELVDASPRAVMG